MDFVSDLIDVCFESEVVSVEYCDGYVGVVVFVGFGIGWNEEWVVFVLDGECWWFEVVEEGLELWIEF